MAKLPSGTVTFLLTDVEGSTALWEEAPEAMRAALARHDEVLRPAIVDHGGHVVKTTGDGFHAAFGRADEGVAAAIDAQRRLQAEPWGEVGPLRVRMALHTGLAEERGGDYYGPPLNRLARLLSAGHGGQLLLSQATAELVRDALPEGVDLLDLGEHRLKDLVRPERVFQLAAPDLPTGFAPLRTLDARRHNLPTHPTALLGRERELAEVRRLFGDGARLVTLTGPGGTGKTRLALQVAAELLDHFPDGVFFVELAPLTEPDLAIATVAHVLGLREAGGRSLRDTVTSYLKDKHLLLVLDNFEQILVAAPLVADLLAACPMLKVLVTSRAVLRLRGEREFAVPPLALPDSESQTSVEALGQYAAVSLFGLRAVDAKADFSLTDENAPTVAEICRRLDGLPLAIELAAARIKVLSPEELLRRLERRLPLLTGGAWDLPARQRTLRDTIVWSYELLDEAERRLFRRLSVFVGGFTLAAAEAICTPDGEAGIDVLEGVASLVHMSLLRQHRGVDGEARFGMLETIREFALEQLEASGEAGRTQRLHAEHYLALAEIARPRLTGPDQSAWLARLQADHDNMRAALARSLEDRESTPIALGLAWALYRFWQRGGHVSEGRDWLARALARSALSDGETRARLLNAAGVLARTHGDNPPARSFFEESLAIYRRLGDRGGLANALHNLGSVIRYEGDYERAAVLLDESVALWRVVGDRWGLAHALTIQGGVARDLGEDGAATALYEESLALLREVEDPWSVATQLGELGILVHEQGDRDRATSLFTQYLAIRRGLGDRMGTAWAFAKLGRVAHEQRDCERSSELYSQALRLYREIGNRWGPIVCVEGLAALAASTGRPRRSASLFGAAEVLREAIREPLPPPERAWLHQAVTAARALLADEDFAAAWAEGRAMTLEQAVAYALDEQPSA